jgi:hypothetical protein
MQHGMVDGASRTIDNAHEARRMGQARSVFFV